MILNSDVMSNNTLENFVRFANKIELFKKINNKLKFKYFITFKDKTKIFNIDDIILYDKYEVGMVFSLKERLIIISTFLKKEIIYDLYNIDSFVYNVYIDNELLYKEKLFYELEIILKNITGEKN